MGSIITAYVTSSVVVPNVIVVDGLTEGQCHTLTNSALECIPDRIRVDERMALSLDSAQSSWQTLVGVVHSTRHGQVSIKLANVVRKLSQITFNEGKVFVDEAFVMAPLSWSFMMPGLICSMADETMYSYFRFLLDSRSRVKLKYFGAGLGERGLGIVSSSSDCISELGSAEIEGLVGFLWERGQIVDVRSLYDYRGTVYEMHGPASFLNASCHDCANCAFIYKGNKQIAVVYTGVPIKPNEEYLCAYGPGHEHLVCPKCNMACN